MNYLRIRKGKFAEKADEATLGAKRREWIDRDTGAAKHAFDVLYDHVAGTIVKAEPVDGKFGQVFEITLKNVTAYSFVKKGEFAETKMEEVMITIPMTDRNNFGHFAEKIMSADLKKEIKISPYWIKGTSGAVNKEGEYYPTVGLNIFQGDKKLQSKYWKDKKRTNKFPKIEEGWDSDDWGVYRIKVKKFLLAEVAKLSFPEPEDDGFVKDEIATAEDLPF